jgi:Protein of unknown function (DUF3489)
MANSKQIASSTKSARSARKGGAAGKKSIKSQPAWRGQRAATTPEVKAGETKQGRVITLLGRDTGASLGELIAATGWLPHTTRAALTGLRRKGFVLDRDKRADGTTVYRISSAPAASSPSNAG